MRLLNTSTPELKEFIVDIPLYAILSHTCGKEEVVFNDVAGKKGFRLVVEKRGLFETERLLQRGSSEWIRLGVDGQLLHRQM
jgi:hypothetical protein